MKESAHPPLPVPNEVSAAFWAAAAEHSFVLARCTRCGIFAHPPSVVCQRCLHPQSEFGFVPVDGGGRICSWVVFQDSFLPGFDVPYVLVDVELDVQPGLRLIGRLVEGPEATIQRGSRVNVVFDDIAPGVSIPAFGLEASL